MTQTHSTSGCRRRGAWRDEAWSRGREELAGCLGEEAGRVVARSGHQGRRLVWWTGVQWGSRIVTVRVVDDIPKLLE